MAIININGCPFEYTEENLTYDTIQPLSLESGKKLLIKTKELFDSIGLEFYLSFGTLLGAVRDKAIIKGDEDIDIFIENENLLFRNLPLLSEKGLKVIRIKRGTLYSFRLNSESYIDVYILRSLPIYNIWSIYCKNLSGYFTPKKYFSDYQDIEFLGEKYMCPKKPENLLEFWYGKNWRIPQRGHKFIYEVKSAYYWHQFTSKFKILIKFCIGWKYWNHIIKSDVK